MTTRKLSVELANAIYDILIDECRAPVHDRESFVIEFSMKDHPTNEWRFQGALGFGGKFYFQPDLEPLRAVRVGFYREDETPLRMGMMRRANDRLVVLWKKKGNA